MFRIILILLRCLRVLIFVESESRPMKHLSVYRRRRRRRLLPLPLTHRESSSWGKSKSAPASI